MLLDQRRTCFCHSWGKILLLKWGASGSRHGLEGRTPDPNFPSGYVKMTTECYLKSRCVEPWLFSATPTPSFQGQQFGGRDLRETPPGFLRPRISKSQLCEGGISRFLSCFQRNFSCFHCCLSERGWGWGAYLKRCQQDFSLSSDVSASYKEQPQSLSRSGRVGACSSQGEKAS